MTTMAAFLDFIRVDFDRSVKTIVDERAALIAEREKRVRNHQQVKGIDEQLKPLTHALLRRRRKSVRLLGRGAWA